MEWYYAAAIVALIALIALVAYQASGGWGSALWNAVGFFGALLKSFLSNPVLWLIGLGLLSLLGPAITSIAKDQLKKLINKVIDAENADDARDPDQRLTDAQKEVVVEKMKNLAVREAIDEDSSLNQAEKQDAIAAADSSFGSARSSIVQDMEKGGLSPEEANGDADEAESFGDEIWGIENRSQRRAPRHARHDRSHG
jgi:hypothetical protein